MFPTVLIVAEVGDGPAGNIAIDEIEVAYGRCSNIGKTMPHVSRMYLKGFEQNNECISFVMQIGYIPYAPTYHATFHTSDLDD